MIVACSFLRKCVNFYVSHFHNIPPLGGIWAISLVVEQRSPKPLAGVRFSHRPLAYYVCNTNLIFIYIVL